MLPSNFPSLRIGLLQAHSRPHDKQHPKWSLRRRHVVLASVGSTSKSELESWDLDFDSDEGHTRRGVKSEEGDSEDDDEGTFENSPLASLLKHLSVVPKTWGRGLLQ